LYFSLATWQISMPKLEVICVVDLPYQAVPALRLVHLLAQRLLGHHRQG
jgi:hypothetical protein